MDSVYNKLIELGIRPSVQRVAIMNYLATHHTHPTVEEVFLALKKKLPTVSRTTVYNTLRMLSEHGAASMITIDDHRVCYDGVTEPHAHFFCKRCEKVFDFETMEMPRYTGEIGKGFRIDDTQLYYKGICPDCLKAMSEEEGLN